MVVSLLCLLWATGSVIYHAPENKSSSHCAAYQPGLLGGFDWTGPIVQFLQIALDCLSGSDNVLCDSVEPLGTPGADI